MPEIRPLGPLFDTLATIGWNRQDGARLAKVLQQILEHSRASGRTEILGRTGALLEILDEFMGETPVSGRLTPVLQAVIDLADRLDRGPFAEWQDAALLPSTPGDWTFLVAGDEWDAESSLYATLCALDFQVEVADGGDALARLRQSDRTILLAKATWLAARPRSLCPPRPRVTPTPPVGSLIVGVVDTADRACLLQACRAGAELLLDRPLAADRLLSELAGLAWMPTVPYRVLLIDTESERLVHHTDLLRAAGCEVFASQDALAALTLLDQRVPEVCVLGQVTPTEDHVGLAMLLRRQNAPAGIPIIHLPHLAADAKPPLTASAAGCALPEPHRLAQMVLRRARAFRRRQNASQREGQARRAHAELTNTLDQCDVSIGTDMTEQKRKRAQRQRQVRLLDLQRQALQQFIATQDPAAASAHLLDGLLILTDSAHGFILELCANADGTPFLKPLAISGIAWNEQTRHLLDAANAEGMVFRNFQNLFGTILHTGEATIVEDLAGHLSHLRLPEGHPSLQAFLGIPIRNRESILGILGLANRPGGYDQSDVDALHTLTDTSASLLQAARRQATRQSLIDETHCARDIAGDADHPAATHDPDPAAMRARPAEPASDETAHQGHRRVLLAEDNLTNQAVLKMQIEALGYEVDTANDGSAALAKWKAGGHDLLLTDLHMPGMDGLALTRSIRAAEQEHGGHLPIIAITGTEQPERLAACRLAGIDDVLPKPITLDELHRRLDPWLSRAMPSHTVATTSALPASVSDATLDTAYIIRLVGNIGRAQMRDLIDLFTATARADLRNCHHRRRTSDAKQLALTMHKLKSSARMVGALHFAALAEQLETTVETDSLDAVSALITALDDAVGDVETAAQRLIDLPTPTLTETDLAQVPPEFLPQRVLVVDDDDIARRQTSLLLESLGIPEVLTIDNGDEALAEIDRASSAGINLVIIDLNMPGMDGVEFLRGLAQCGYTGDLVISSGVDEQLLRTVADLVRARGLHLRGAVKKPLTRDSLVHLLTLPRAPVVRPAPAVTTELVAQDILDGIGADAFCMHFQPKVDASTLRVVGVEALARWWRDGVPIRPDLFINAAERHGLITPLSNLLLTKTLRDGARLAAAGFPLTIAFNISPLWLSDIHLPEFILDLVQITSFPADRLILEITESSLLADLDTAMDVLTRLRLKGFTLSIDDFGTGYSSMEQLQRIPFSELKLDRTFVNGAAERPAVRAILAASIEMARKLHLTTVAEGVETPADLDLVRGLGCDMVQGWLIAKAMPVAELIAWLQAQPAQRR